MLKEDDGPAWLAAIGLPHLWVDVAGEIGGPLALATSAGAWRAFAAACAGACRAPWRSRVMLPCRSTRTFWMYSHSTRPTGAVSEARSTSASAVVRPNAAMISSAFDRLGEIVRRAHLDRLDRRRDARVPGQYDDADVGIEVLQLLHEREARRPRHAQVDHGESRSMLLRAPQSLRHVVGNRDREAAALHRSRQHPTERHVVVDDEQGWPLSGHPAGARHRATFAGASR